MDFDFVWYCHNCKETRGWEGHYPKCHNCKKKTEVIRVYADHLKMIPEKLTTTPQSTAIAQIAAEMERTAESRIKTSGYGTWVNDVFKWARQLRTFV